MNARTRLKREIIRRRRREPWPMIFTRITAPNGLRIQACLYIKGQRVTASYEADGHLVHAAWPPTLDVFQELNHWVSVRCWSCMDWGYIEIFHPSTDGLIGHRNCPDLDDPRRHPPAKPVPLHVETVPAHLPGCKGDNPWCCPPF